MSFVTYRPYDTSVGATEPVTSQSGGALPWVMVLGILGIFAVTIYYQVKGKLPVYPTYQRPYYPYMY